MRTLHDLRSEKMQRGLEKFELARGRPRAQRVKHCLAVEAKAEAEDMAVQNSRRGEREASSGVTRMRRRSLFCAAVPFLSILYRTVDSFSFRVQDISVMEGKHRPRSLSRLDAMQREANAASNEASSSPVFVLETSADTREIRRRVVSFLQERDFGSARQMVEGMLEFLRDEASVSNNDLEEMSSSIDQTLQTFYNSAFNPPYRGSASKKRISHGVDLLNIQLSHPTLVSPYNKVPKTVLLGALRALTGVNEVTPLSSWSGETRENADIAYRILQRLVTGMGIRDVSVGTVSPLQEKDFALVLKAYTNIGKMDMAHRIVALQERTASAPLISPVAFSILLKGYGNLGDLYNVDMLLGHADARGIRPDTIMMNSLIDAYINCGEFDKAQTVFDIMMNPTSQSSLSVEYPTLFSPGCCPKPCQRTFNTMLKGLARRGMLAEAQKLSGEMKAKHMWDHVTTNTLVQAAVKAREFGTAEEILEEHTMENKKKGKSHPNSEAYTSAVDGLAKEGEIGKALDLLRRMKSRGVDPNEFTYTSIIGALAKDKKIDQANKMLQHMKAEGIPCRVVTYNAFVSGLVHREGPFDDPLYDRHVDEAIVVLKHMMKEGVHPNAVTVSVLVGAFGKCDPPRVTEAIALVEKLEEDGIVRKGNLRISTAIIQLFGAVGNFNEALSRFRSIGQPDVASINSILDVCVRCHKDTVTMKIFHESFQGPRSTCRPDVISYSCAINSALKKLSYSGSKDARTLYEEMKYRRRITPDNALVDM